MFDYRGRQMNISAGLEALDAGAKLDAATAKYLETVLKNEPNDVDSRLRLLGFYRTENKQKRFEGYLHHLLWMIKNVPEEPILSFLSLNYKNDYYRQAVKEWLRQVRLHAQQDIVYHNAARFCTAFNPALAEVLWKRAEAIDPLNEIYPRELSSLFWSIARNGESYSHRRYASMAFEEYAKAVELHEKKSVSSFLDIYKETMLKDLADLALRFLFLEQARDYGRTLLSLQPIEESCKSYDLREIVTTKYRFAAHRGHSVLGRASLRDNDTDQALAHLNLMTLNPLPNSFDTTLASELLNASQNKSVIDYLEYCKQQLTAELKLTEPNALKPNALMAAAYRRLESQGMDSAGIVKQFAKPLEARIATIEFWMTEINQHRIPTLRSE